MGEIIKHWTEIVTAAMAVAAFLVAGWSLKVSRDAFNLAKAQDERRRPQLVPVLQDCHFITLPDGAGRGYVFNLSIRNRSDADNAIADISLHVTYKKSGASVTAKMPLRLDPRPGILAVPMKIGAHDTISGFCHFHVDAGIVKESEIEAYSVVLTDSHDQASSVEPQIIRERENA